jgi:hypothetical protein
MSPSGVAEGFVVLRPAASFSYNTSLPWGFNDAAVWQGKGATAWLSGGIQWRSRRLSVRLEPMAFAAQNAAFELSPHPGVNPNPFLDQQRPDVIDLPQRFGDGRYARISPGQSHVRLDVSGLYVALATENVGWGPSLKNPLLLGPNAEGFPHVSVGTSEVVRTPAGAFHGQLLFGQLTQSAFAPDTRGEGKRLASGMIASWSPPGAPGLEMGVARFFHRNWPQRLGLEILRTPFGGQLSETQALGEDTDDNQLGNLFARYVSPAAALELYGEFGKNDRNANLRDALVEPDHSAAWTLGFLKRLGAPAAEFWSVRGEVVNGRATALQRIRSAGTFYQHTPVTEGHTERGQLLGAPLLERAGGFELAVDYWESSGRMGAMLTQRLMPIADLVEGSRSAEARAQWAVEVNGTTFSAQSAISWRAGILVDFNRSPGADARSVFAGISWRGVP